MDYSNCIIYKIQHRENRDLIYIGHTTNPLSVRLKSHISLCKRYSNKFYKLIQQNGGFDCFECSVVEEYSCETKDKAREREEYWRTSLNAIMNTNRAYIPEENKLEVVSQRNRDWYIKNRQKILDSRRQLYISDPKKINERVKQYRVNNHEKIKKKARDKYHSKRMNQNDNP